MFTGVGGFEEGINKATNGKWQCIGFSENDKRCSELLAKKYPDTKNYGDATKIDTRELPNFDLLCGGFPCQSFSIAGNRKGFEETRGTMFFEIARIAKDKKPKYLLLENVRGLLNHDGGKTFKTILKTIDELGYDAEWMVIDSYLFDASPRPRIFIFAVHREQEIDVRKRIKQTTSLLFLLSERVRLTDNSARDKKVGRSSGRIIREFTKLPCWLDSWVSIYDEEENDG